MTKLYFNDVAAYAHADNERRERSYGRKLVALHASGVDLPRLVIICVAARVGPTVGSASYSGHVWSGIDVVQWLTGRADRVNKTHRRALLAACHAAGAR